MIFQDTIDDLDSVIAELADLRQALIVAEHSAHPVGSLWDIEAALRRASNRAEHRAATVRRVIELVETSQDATGADATQASGNVSQRRIA